jgi:hypothetical protein
MITGERWLSVNSMQVDFVLQKTLFLENLQSLLDSHYLLLRFILIFLSTMMNLNSWWNVYHGWLRLFLIEGCHLCANFDT